MGNQTEKETAPIPSVGADGEQSLANECTHSITENQQNFNAVDEEMLKFQQAMEPDFIFASTLSQLLDQTIPPKKSVMDGFLHSGTYIFAGAPKIGKSFLAAQICYHVSLGLPLWSMPTKQGVAYYLALEDDVGRLQHRFSTMYGVEGSDSLYLSTEAKKLGEGLEKQIAFFVRNHPDTSLVVLDTLKMIRGMEKMSYANDYEAVARIKAVSDSLDICIIVVHHTRKQGADDPFDTISGTNGLLGAADGGMVMYKENRMSDRVVLSAVGRDQRDLTLTLKQLPHNQVWETCTDIMPLDRAPDYPLLPLVADFVEEQGGTWTGRASDLVAQLAEVQVPLNLLTRQLNVGSGWLFHQRGLHYENTHTKQGSRLIFRPASQGK